MNDAERLAMFERGAEQAIRDEWWERQAAADVDDTPAPEPED